MADIRSIKDKKLHVTVYLKGQCKLCKKHNQKKIHDYGILTFEELDRKLDETKHYITPLRCGACQNEFSAEKLFYFEESNKTIITETQIAYGNSRDEEEAKMMEKAHRERFEIYVREKEQFWNQYTDYAIANWRDMINELVDFEIKEAFQKLNIDTNAKTIGQYRKEVFNHLKTIEEKERFWRSANEYFIESHLLDIGPMGWLIEQDVKYYGRNRMRFIILHFPLGEGFEKERTEWIGRVIKKEKGDNAFLFRRIGMLTDEIQRIRQKMTKYYHQIEELKAEKAQLQEKLSNVYEQIRIEREGKNIISRDPSDIQKIHELKSFIRELIDELKRKDSLIEELQPEEEMNAETKKEITLEETTFQEDEQHTLDNLKGKTVAIIGGNRQEQAQKEYSCNILTHTGSKLDNDFYAVIKKADIIIVLTQFVSHTAMWEAKAFAVEENIPIFFEKGLNIPTLLHRTSSKLKR